MGRSAPRVRRPRLLISRIAAANTANVVRKPSFTHLLYLRIVSRCGVLRDQASSGSARQDEPSCLVPERVFHLSFGIACSASKNTLLVNQNTLLTGVGNSRGKTTNIAFLENITFFKASNLDNSLKNSLFAGNSRWRRVRSALRRQPPSHAIRRGLQPARHRPGIPGFSRTSVSLQAPGLRYSEPKSRKVSDLYLENSRFAETIGRDWFDHDCRPIVALCFDRFSNAK
jgi:hypothetical protein